MSSILHLAKDNNISFDAMLCMISAQDPSVSGSRNKVFTV